MSVQRKHSDVQEDARLVCGLDELLVLVDCLDSWFGDEDVMAFRYGVECYQ